MLAHGQRLESAVTLTDLDGGARFPGLPHTRVVARPADRDRGILRQLAVQAVRGVDIGEVRRRSPGRRRQNPTVQAGGSPMVRVKSPWVKPVGLLRGRPTACTEAM